MKKFFFFLLFLTATLTANAQFEKGKKYVNASVSGLGLSYSSGKGFEFGLNAGGGYFINDCLLLSGTVGYNHAKHTNDVNIGALCRYYFDQCGVSLGAGAEYVHFSKSYNDVRIPIEVGYHFFVNKYIAIEPAVYYKMSIHDFSNNSTVGARIGFGFYF